MTRTASSEITYTWVPEPYLSSSLTLPSARDQGPRMDVHINGNCPSQYSLFFNPKKQIQGPKPEGTSLPSIPRGAISSTYPISQSPSGQPTRVASPKPAPSTEQRIQAAKNKKKSDFWKDEDTRMKLVVDAARTLVGETAGPPALDLPAAAAPGNYYCPPPEPEKRIREGPWDESIKRL